MLDDLDPSLNRLVFLIQPIIPDDEHQYPAETARDQDAAHAYEHLCPGDKPGLIGPAVVDMCPVVPVEEIFPTNQVIDIGGILKGSQGVCVAAHGLFPAMGAVTLNVSTTQECHAYIAEL